MLFENGPRDFEPVFADPPGPLPVAVAFGEPKLERVQTRGLISTQPMDVRFDVGTANVLMQKFGSGVWPLVDEIPYRANAAFLPDDNGDRWVYPFLMVTNSSPDLDFPFLKDPYYRVGVRFGVITLDEDKSHIIKEMSMMLTPFEALEREDSLPTDPRYLRGQEATILPLHGKGRPGFGIAGYFTRAYPVVSADPYGLWFLVVAVANSRVRRRNAAGRKPQHRLKRSLGRAPSVVPEHELVKVDRELRAAHSMVSADEPVLHIPDGPVCERDRGLGSLSQLREMRLDAWNVRVASQPLEGLEPVRVNRGPRLDVATDESADGRCLEIGDDLHPRSPGSTAPLLDCNQHQRSLAPLELAAAPQSRLGAAHPCLVDLDLTSQRLARSIDHGSTKLVQNHPRRFVPADSELMLQQERRQTALVRRHQVCRPEPRRQCGLRVV